MIIEMKEFLILNFMRKWFLMVVMRLKFEEYREISEHYVKQIFDYKKSGISVGEFVERLKAEGNESDLWEYCRIDDSTVLECRNGMMPKHELPYFWAKIGRPRIGIGKENWGAEPGKEYFVFDIKDVTFVSWKAKELIDKLSHDKK